MLTPRQTVAAVWTHRAASEREATARFGRLRDRLARVEASPAVVELAARAAADERRHESLCAELARAFGGASPAEDGAGAPEIAPAGLGLRERVLYEVVAQCCVAETMNAALLSVTLQHVTEPAVRATVRELLADEVEHARMGWAHLSWEAERAGIGWLEPLLGPMLEGSVTEELGLPAALPPDAEALLALGVLPRPLRVELFRASLRDIVLPGFEAHGLATATLRRRWGVPEPPERH